MVGGASNQKTFSFLVFFVSKTHQTLKNTMVWKDLMGFLDFFFFLSWSFFWLGPAWEARPRPPGQAWWFYHREAKAELSELFPYILQMVLENGLGATRESVLHISRLTLYSKCLANGSGAT